MQRLALLSLSILLATTAAAHAGGVEDVAVDMPSDLRSRIEAAGVWDQLDVAINPFYLRGDFDGDKRIDYVIGVKDAKTADVHLLVLRGKGKPISLDDQMSGMPHDRWYVHTKGAAFDYDVSLPKLRGDAIMVGYEDGSILVYWTGKKFVTMPLGD